MDTLSEADLDAASLHWTTNHDDRRAADADDRRIAFTVVPLANPMVVGDMKRVSPTFSARRCPDLLRPSDAVAPARKIPRGFTTQIGARIAVTEVVGDDKDNVRLLPPAGVCARATCAGPFAAIASQAVLASSCDHCCSFAETA